MPKFKLRFKESRIKYYAEQYDYPKEPHIIKDVKPSFYKKGYLTKQDFIDLCDWKTQRTRPRVQKNTAEYIEEITTIAINTSNEQLKIEILTLLNGVGWPTASTILHFHNYKYPILDFRALWSLKTDVPDKYTFDFWWEYVIFTRDLARRNKVDMRTLDRALWKFSEQKQPRD